MQWLDWIVVAAYIGVLVWITLAARRTRLLEDFTVASRDMPRAMIFATLGATYIGPAYTLGIAGSAAEHGYVWYLIGIMVPLQTILVGSLIARAFGEVVGAFTGIPAETVIIVGTLPVILYAAWGGVKTVMLTDVPTASRRWLRGWRPTNSCSGP